MYFQTWNPGVALNAFASMNSTSRVLVQLLELQFSSSWSPVYTGLLAVDGEVPQSQLLSMVVTSPFTCQILIVRML